MAQIFTGAEKDLRQSVQDLSEERIKSELHSREVEWYSCPLPEWRFQPPAAATCQEFGKGL